MVANYESASGSSRGASLRKAARARGRGVTSRLRRASQRIDQRVQPRQLDQALGWFSLGLGVLQVLAPRGVGRMIGAGDHPAVMRLCGMREIASGIVLLSDKAPASGAMSRVAGDAVDLALLGAAMRSPDAQPGRLAVAATTVLGVTAVDMYAAGRHSREALAQADEAVPVTVSIAINSAPDKLYTFWRDFGNLPLFMEHLVSVTTVNESVSHWIAKGPAGTLVEWDAEVVEDQPNEFISWRTLPDSDVRHHGQIRFEPAVNGRGTMVRVEMAYGAPGGTWGAAIAKLSGEEPELQIKRDLRAFKQLMETGEVATTRGQPSGARSLLGKALARRES